MNCCDAVDNASNTVVLCPNPFRDTKLELTEMARDILLSEGFETAICPVFGRDEKSVIPPELEIISDVTGKAEYKNKQLAKSQTL